MRIKDIIDKAEALRLKCTLEQDIELAQRYFRDYDEYLSKEVDIQ